MRDSPCLGMGGSTHCVPAFAQASTLTKRRIERERERGRKRAQAKNAGKSPQCVVLLRTAWTRGNIEDPSPVSPNAPLRRRLMHNQNKAKICVSCFACAFLSCWAFHSNSRCFCAACCVSHASPALVVTHTHTYSDSHTYTYGRRLAQRFHLIFSSVSVSRSWTVVAFGRLLSSSSASSERRKMCYWNVTQNLLSAPLAIRRV